MSGAELLTDEEIDTIETRWNEQRVRVEAGAVPDPERERDAAKARSG